MKKYKLYAVVSEHPGEPPFAVQWLPTCCVNVDAMPHMPLAIAHTYQEAYLMLKKIRKTHFGRNSGKKIYIVRFENVTRARKK